jgi:hypothetical protein
MTKPDQFTVGFRGDFSPAEEDALTRAGYRVYRNAIHPVVTMWNNDVSTAQVSGDPRPRHVITAVTAGDANEAARKVKELIGRDDLEDLIVDLGVASEG